MVPAHMSPESQAHETRSLKRGPCTQVACRFTAQLCTTCGTPAMEAVIRSILPMLGDTTDAYKRMGAVESLHRVVHRMGLSIVPFSIFLVVPILGRMSDQNTAVRQCATQCFGTLLQLLPLEAGIPDPEGLSQDLASKKVDERRFLEQLLDTSKVDNYVIPVKIDATLRRYQQEGVNWMAFLMKYQLHGVLADDMGLGKTLQTICIIASDHHDRRTANASAPSGANAPIPSLVVCPPTLVGHWGHEIEKFTSGRLGCVLYYGSPAERKGLRAGIKGTDKVVVTSYETVRSDADFLGSLDWDYCVLDEGHVIKNPKSGISKAVKSIKANHRLLLSGTPIQNNVLELWSLFDFLMPGFLGTEQHFAAAYSKPILASRYPEP
jgi:TATA-binding protein-associated factor